MKKITDYKELSPLIMKYYKRGVLTNCFLSKDDYIAEISEGRLFYKSDDSYLCLYLLRDGHYQLYFYALDSEVIFPSADMPLICDCVGYEDLLKHNGFSKLITRTRLEHEGTDGVLNETVIASVQDATEVHKLMTESFDPITGYVPTLAQIKNECENGGIFKIVIDEKLAAVIRPAITKNNVHIRHLCVSKDFRGRGLGSKLCGCVLSHGKRCSVWTGSENTVALSMYKSFGFKENGLTSVVYRKDV